MRSLATMLAVTATIGAVAGPAAARPADARPAAPITATASAYCPIPAATHAAWARGDFAPAPTAACASTHSKVCPTNNPAFSGGGRAGGVSAVTLGGAGLVVLLAAGLVLVAVRRRHGRGPAAAQPQS
ncbi:MAG TPA: hypothetical protein VH834_00690 [Solirubrobacteraceae bacterium]|jgi:hypothetical protein